MLTFFFFVKVQCYTFNPPIVTLSVVEVQQNKFLSVTYIIAVIMLIRFVAEKVKTLL